MNIVNQSLQKNFVAKYTEGSFQSTDVTRNMMITPKFFKSKLEISGADTSANGNQANKN